MDDDKRQTYQHDFSKPYFDMHFAPKKPFILDSNIELNEFLKTEANISKVETIELVDLKQRLATSKAKKTCYVHLCVQDGKAVIINPFNSKIINELPNNAKLLKISADDYDKKLQPVIKLEVNANSIMRDCITSSVGDALWQSAGQVAISSAAISVLGMVGAPFVLSATCGLFHAHRARKQFEKEHGRAPSKAESKQIRNQGIGFAFATGVAMFGWQAAIVGAKLAAQLLNFTPHGMAINVGLAMLTGIGQGVGAAIADAILQKQQTGEIKIGSVITSFTQGFVAGALCYGISTIPFGGVAASVLAPVLTTAVAMTTAFITNFAATLAITATFQFTKSSIGHFWNKHKPSFLESKKSLEDKKLAAPESEKEEAEAESTNDSDAQDLAPNGSALSNNK